jgi:phage tail protein X
MIIQNRTRAGWALIRSCQHRMDQAKTHRWRVIGATSACIVCLLTVGAIYLNVAHKNSYQLPAQIFQSDETVAQVQSRIQPSLKKTPDLPEVEVIQAAPQGVQDMMQQKHSENQEETPYSKQTPQTQVLQTAVLSEPIQPPVVQDASPALPARNDAPSPKKATRPDSLGRLRVKPGDTLLELIKLVYGTLSNRYVRRIIDANPQIENPNTINLNDEITFPALSFTINADCRDEYYIIMNQYTSIGKARDQLESLKRQLKQPFVMIGHWSEKDGLQFSIVAQPSFEDHQTADGWIKTLPEKIAGTVRIQSGWPEGIVAYSNYLRTVRRQPSM